MKLFLSRLIHSLLIQKDRSVYFGSVYILVVMIPIINCFTIELLFFSERELANKHVNILIAALYLIGVIILSIFFPAKKMRAMDLEESIVKKTLISFYVCLGISLALCLAVVIYKWS